MIRSFLFVLYCLSFFRHFPFSMRPSVRSSVPVPVPTSPCLFSCPQQGFLSGYPNLPHNELHQDWQSRFLFGFQFFLKVCRASSMYDATYYGQGGTERNIVGGPSLLQGLPESPPHSRGSFRFSWQAAEYSLLCRSGTALKCAPNLLPCNRWSNLRYRAIVLIQ